MIGKSSLTAPAAALLGFGMLLGSCAPFGGFVADHWPHWAGGLPPDAPPRPGAPGYEEFIAHGETPPAAPSSPSAGNTGTSPKSANTQKSNGQADKAGNGKVDVGHVQSTPPQPNVQQESVQPEAETAAPAAEDTSVTRGGLY